MSTGAGSRSATACARRQAGGDNPTNADDGEHCLSTSRAVSAHVDAGAAIRTIGSLPGSSRLLFTHLFANDPTAVSESDASPGSGSRVDAAEHVSIRQLRMRSPGAIGIHSGERGRDHRAGKSTRSRTGTVHSGRGPQRMPPRSGARGRAGVPGRKPSGSARTLPGNRSIRASRLAIESSAASATSPTAARLAAAQCSSVSCSFHA